MKEMVHTLVLQDSSTRVAIIDRLGSSVRLSCLSRTTSETKPFASFDGGSGAPERGAPLS